MRNDVVYWLQERALRRYGATMNAAHTETQEWLWADEITRLREENARLLAANKDLQLHFDVVKEDLEKAEEENARLREALSYYAEEDYNGYNGSGACARAAIREGGNDEN